MTSAPIRVVGVATAALALGALVTILFRAGASGEEVRPEPAPGAAEVPAPLVAPPHGPAAGAPAPPGPRAAPPQDPESALTERLRATADVDPVAAFRLAEEGERRFPAGRLADERSFLKMRALVHLGLVGAARDEADLFFERYPDSPFGESASRLTGVHPRPPPGRRGR